MRELLDDLAALGPVPAERLETDRTTRYAVERVLIALVDLAVGRESFATAAEVGLLPEELARRLTPSTGLRNVLVREYVDVVRGRVAAAVQPAY